MNRRPSNLPIDAIQKNTPLDGVEQAFRVDTPLRTENRAIDIAVATGAPISETVRKVQQGDSGPVAAAKASAGDVVGNTINNSRDQGVPPEDAAVLVADAQQKKSDMDAFSDFVLEGAMTAGDPNYNPALARLTTNQQIAMEVMEERFKSANDTKGWGGTALDFIDRYMLRQIPIGTVEDLWGRGRTQRKGLELAQAAASMSPDEYREYITAYADELAEEGIFRGDNWFALQQGLSEATNAGYDPTARFLELLSVADLTAAGALVKTAGKGTKLFGRVAKVKGVGAADEAVEAAVKSGAKDIPEVADELLPSHLQVGKVEDAIVPTQGRTQKIFEDNLLVQKVQELWNKGTFGRAASSEQIQVIAGRITQNLVEISSRPLAKTDVVDLGLGAQAVSAKFGKAKDGLPFANAANAEKFSKSLQEKGLSARVVTVDADDLKKGYYVEVQERMDLSSVAAPVNVEAAYGNIVQRALRPLASARANDDPILTTLANLGESGQAAINDLVQPMLEKYRKIPLAGKKAIDAVYRELRDGQDAFLREAYTEDEFRVKFKANHPNGKAPTQKDIEAYYDLQTMNDAAYIFEANKLTSRYVTKGFKGIDIGGEHVPAKKFDGVVAGETQVWDANISRLVTRNELNPEEALWKLDRPLDGGVEYISRPKNVRELQYDDVLPYNAGGRRTNPDANYFVTSGNGRGRALFAAFSEKQAIKGAKQLEEIFSVARATGRKLEDLTGQLDDVIRRNNDWNPSIENTADFLALAKRKGWDINESVSYKARDGVVEKADDVFDGMSYGEYTMAAKKRQDDVLMEFGGAEVSNQSPVQSIAAQLSDSSMNFAMQNYSNSAKAAWLKKALRVSELPEGTDVNRLFAETEVGGKGAMDKRLQSLKNIILRREGVKDPLSQGIADFGEQLQEFVFDTTGSKAGRVFTGAEGKLLGFGFQSAFGFMAISQMFLQATHAAAIIAMSPKHGGKGAAMAMPIIYASRFGRDPQVNKLFMKRFASTFDMSIDEANELVDYMRTSGRMNIEADAIERGVGGGFGTEGATVAGEVAGKVGQVLDAGLLPFNVGEKASRQTAILTAISEYKAKFGKSIMTDDARAWITRREQDLSFNMTTVNRGKWQAGAMKVPTQWLSYSMRSMEALFVGKGLSGAERARLGIFMALTGGVSGTVIGDRMFGLSDKIGESVGADPEGVAFTAIKYGVIDGVLSWAMSGLSGTDVRTAFGTRIAPLTAFEDIYDKMVGNTPDSTIGVLAGPSGEMAGSTLTALWNVASNVYSGRDISATDDIMRVLRQPSGVDAWVKAVGIWNHGMYRSKTGTTVPIEMGGMDGLMAAMGVTNFKVAEFYDRRTMAFRETKHLKSFTKEVQNDFRRAIFEMKTDPSSGLQRMREIEAKIQISGFSPSDKMALRRAMKADTTNDLFTMSLELLRKENPYGAKVVEGLNIQEN